MTSFHNLKRNRAGAAGSPGSVSGRETSTGDHLTVFLPSIIRLGGPSQTPFNRRLK
jgi:hypothetical protein